MDALQHIGKQLHIVKVLISYTSVYILLKSFLDYEDLALIYV